MEKEKGRVSAGKEAKIVKTEGVVGGIYGNFIKFPRKQES